MAAPTTLVRVPTRLHGEGHFLVPRKEYEAREDQVYAIVAKYDEAMRRRDEDFAAMARMSKDLADLKAEYENAKRVIAKVLGLI